MTPFIKKKEVKKDWYIVNAENAAVGRLAAFISKVLRGKNKPSFNPHIDNGDFVVVTNVEKINVTGNKYEDKMYYRHSGYVGNLKSFTYKEMSETNPERILRLAVKGMLPNNKLGRKMLTRLKIYTGDTHPHTSQLG